MVIVILYALSVIQELIWNVTGLYLIYFGDFEEATFRLHIASKVKNSFVEP